MNALAIMVFTLDRLKQDHGVNEFPQPILGQSSGITTPILHCMSHDIGICCKNKLKMIVADMVFV